MEIAAISSRLSPVIIAPPLRPKYFADAATETPPTLRANHAVIRRGGIRELLKGRLPDEILATGGRRRRSRLTPGFLVNWGQPSVGVFEPAFSAGSASSKTSTHD